MLLFLLLIGLSSITRAYDEDIALAMFKLSAGAYSTDPSECINASSPAYTLYSQYMEECDSLSPFFLFSTVCHFFVVVDVKGREVAVAFRGTNSYRQLALELAAAFDSTDFNALGEVNTYFSEGIALLWDNLEGVLEEFGGGEGEYSITFTGHSLGGALAALAAIQTVQKGLFPSERVEVYTFGEPRVGDRHFTANYNRLVPNTWGIVGQWVDGMASFHFRFRVVNSQDIVPHMPACSKAERSSAVPCARNGFLLFDAYHHITEVWYREGMPGPFVVCKGEPVGEDIRCSDGQDFDFLDVEFYLDDHINYFGRRVSTYGVMGCRGE